MYVELYNAGDLDGVMNLYAEDSVQLMPDGIFEGRSTIRDRLGQGLAAFSDQAHRSIRRVQVQGIELGRMRDGKIAVDNLYHDNLAIAVQLGLLPQQVPTTM